MKKIRDVHRNSGFTRKMQSKIIINIIKTGTLLSKSCVIFFIFWPFRPIIKRCNHFGACNSRVSTLLAYIYDISKISCSLSTGRFIWHHSLCTYNAWKVSKYGVFSGPSFSIFGLNTAKYGPEKIPNLDTFHTVVCKNFRKTKTLTPDSSMYVCVPGGKKLSFTNFFSIFLNEWSLVYMATANNRSVCFYALQFHSYIHLMPLRSFMQLNLNLIILPLGPCNKITDINLILWIPFFFNLFW